MKISHILLAAAALGLSGAAVAQTTDSSMGSSSSGMSSKSMHHKKMKKSKSSSMATGSDTNGMRGADTGSAGGASPNGGDTMPTTPSNSATPQ